MTPTDGVVLLDKPSGVSSFKALRPVKKAVSGSKVGHTGTLDPFASGLLVVLTGRMTRIAPKLTGMDKTYEAVFRFGQETDTLDPEGETVLRAPVPERRCIDEHLAEFRGTITQQPPQYSAVHVNGRRAYERVRSGEEVIVPEREVRIDEFSPLSWRNPDLHVRIRASSGTYIRALARDLGRRCDSCAYVTWLRRTEVGPFSVEDALDTDTVDFEKLETGEFVLPPAEVFSDIPGILSATVPEDVVPKIRNGVPLSTSIVADQLGLGPDTDDIALFSPDGILLAVVVPSGGNLKYRFVCAR
ncbi:MAG: tRNA pseudouridine(55) synthase TruB [Spirochaetota bacterium]